MSVQTADCPSCGRANASHRVSCLYCGVAMPNPSAPPPRAERAVPDNLDQLVRDALSGKASSRTVKEVLAASPVAAPPPRAAAPVAPVALDVGAALALIQGVAGDLRVTHASGDTGATRAGVERLAEVVAQLRASLPAEPEVEAPTVPATRFQIPLPPFRHPWALVLGPGEASRESTLADALETDLATARALASCRHSRIALRGPEREDLERKAARCRDRGIAAKVLARTDLGDLPRAEAVVGRTDAGWLVWDDSLWFASVDPERTWPVAPVPVDDVFLVVPGEVEVQSRRATAEPNRWLRQGYQGDRSGNERRVAVVDLHTPSRILRIVEGVCDPDGLPGFEPGSSLKTLRALPEAAVGTWPGARVEGRRSCPAAPASPSDDPAVDGTGWAAWEEHSRAARWLVRG